MPTRNGRYARRLLRLFDDRPLLLARPRAARAGYNRVAKDHLGDEVLAAQKGVPLGLPSRLDEWVRDASTRMIDQIRAGGYSVVGDLDELLPADADSSRSADDTAPFGEAEVLEAAVDALASLLDQRHRDLQTIGTLRREARRKPEPVDVEPRSRLTAARRVAGRGRAGLGRLRARVSGRLSGSR